MNDTAGRVANKHIDLKLGYDVQADFVFVYVNIHNSQNRIKQNNVIDIFVLMQEVGLLMS